MFKQIIVCRVDGCDKPKRTLGMCIAHYGRYLKGKPLDIPLRTSKGTYVTCTVNGCSKPDTASGLCGAHYSRMRNGKSFDDPMRKSPVVGHQSKKCLACNSVIVKKQSHLDLTKYCSRKCAQSDKKGVKNQHWLGGITSINAKARNEFNREFRKLIFTRDNYTCQICHESKSGYMQVDHIKKWSTHPELRFVASNCRTLCMWCHYRVTFGRELPKDKSWGRNTYNSRMATTKIFSN